MTAKTSPFLDTFYGWPYGSNGWSGGMDENLLKFSFMFDGNVDSIVAALPPVSNGAAHFNSADNRFYFGVGGVWYSSPCPKSFIFKIKSNGDFYQFNGTSAVKIDNPSQIDSRLDAVELTLSSLGTAAFQNVEDFATQAELDIVEGQAQGYTDVLRNDLANSTDPAKGAGLVAGSVRTVQSIAALRLLGGRYANDVVSVVGYHADATGVGGGNFIWDATSVAVDDGGTVIGSLPAGRWVRNLGWYVTPQMFGARGNGVADDTSAIQAAVNACKSVLIPVGDVYRVTGKVDVPTDVEIFGGGEIYIDQNPYIRALNLSSGCKVDGVKFRGRAAATALQTTLPGGSRGVAISASGCSNVRVTNCKFYSFISDVINVGAGIVGFGYANNMVVSDCYFDDSNDGFFDIESSYLTGDCIFSRNVSYSNSDVFIGISSVGSGTNTPETEISSVSHHIISDNIHLKRRGKAIPAGRVMGRHGLALHYSEGKSYATITGNIIGVCSRHGIYLRGNEPVDPKPPIGPNLISGNYLVYCGNASGDPSGYHSGLMLEVNQPTVVSGNYIYKSGFFPNGTSGSSVAYDVSTTRGTQYVTLSKNVMVGGRSGAIYLSMSVPGYTTKNIIIDGNQIINHNFGVFVGVVTGAAGISDIKILNNIIELRGAGAFGYTDFGSGTGVEIPKTVGGTPNSLEIINNTVNGIGKSAGQYGICLQCGAPGLMSSTAKIIGNTMRDLQRGLASWRVTTGAVGGQELIPHRVWGVQTKIAGNKFTSCGEALFVPKNSAHFLAFIEPDNTFSDCDATNVAQSVDWLTAVIGRVVGFNASGVAQVELHITTPPTQESYIQGDRTTNPSPAAGGHLGSVCTASGAPGTWRTYGAISS